MGSTYNSCALNNNARRAVGRPVARRRRRRGARGGPRNPLAEPGFSLSSYTIASEPGRYPRRVDPAWKKAEWNLICPEIFHTKVFRPRVLITFGTILVVKIQKIVIEETGGDLEHEEVWRPSVAGVCYHDEEGRQATRRGCRLDLRISVRRGTIIQYS